MSGRGKLTAEEVLEQLLQHAPKMNAPVAEVGRRILEKLERAEGQFRAADLELNALKAKYSETLIELEDLRTKRCFWCRIAPPAPDERTH